MNEDEVEAEAKKRLEHRARVYKITGIRDIGEHGRNNLVECWSQIMEAFCILGTILRAKQVDIPARKKGFEHLRLILKEIIDLEFDGCLAAIDRPETGADQ